MITNAHGTSYKTVFSLTDKQIDIDLKLYRLIVAQYTQKVDGKFKVLHGLIVEHIISKIKNEKIDNDIYIRLLFLSGLILKLDTKNEKFKKTFETLKQQ